MRTEDLIAGLAAEPVPALPANAIGLAAARGLSVGLLVALAAYFLVWGPRPALLAQMQIPLTLAKTLLAAALAALALPLALRASRPGARAGLVGWLLLLVPLAALALFVFGWAETPAELRWRAFVGHSIPVCLPSIVILSLPFFAALLRALQKGAPTRPTRAGALAGLAAGGMATVLYSTFCTEDSPLFYTVWYSGGILLATGLGAIAGNRWLRW